VPYYEKRLVFLGARDLQTWHLQEISDCDKSRLHLPDWMETPKESFFASIQECIAFAKNLPLQYEGYVLVDAQFNRMKVKSESYVRAHHFGSRIVKEKEIIESILKGEQGEILAYQPHLQVKFGRIQSQMEIISRNTWINFKVWFDAVGATPEEQKKERKQLVLFVQKHGEMKYLSLYLVLFFAAITAGADNISNPFLLLQSKCTTKQWCGALEIK
jgi:hypothetical protein